MARSKVGKEMASRMRDPYKAGLTHYRQALADKRISHKEFGGFKGALKKIHKEKIIERSGDKFRRVKRYRTRLGTRPRYGES